MNEFTKERIEETRKYFKKHKTSIASNQLTLEMLDEIQRLQSCQKKIDGLMEALRDIFHESNEKAIVEIAGNALSGNGDTVIIGE